MKLINFFLFILLISITSSFADINKEFEDWKGKQSNGCLRAHTHWDCVLVHPILAGTVFVWTTVPSITCNRLAHEP